jgi:hypothetical protein
LQWYFQPEEMGRQLLGTSEQQTPYLESFRPSHLVPDLSPSLAEIETRLQSLVSWFHRDVPPSSSQSQFLAVSVAPSSPPEPDIKQQGEPLLPAALEADSKDKSVVNPSQVCSGLWLTHADSISVFDLGSNRELMREDVESCFQSSKGESHFLWHSEENSGILTQVRLDPQVSFESPLSVGYLQDTFGRGFNLVILLKGYQQDVQVVLDHNSDVELYYELDSDDQGQWVNVFLDPDNKIHELSFFSGDELLKSLLVEATATKDQLVVLNLNPKLETLENARGVMVSLPSDPRYEVRAFQNSTESYQPLYADEVQVESGYLSQFFEIKDILDHKFRTLNVYSGLETRLNLSTVLSVLEFQEGSEMHQPHGELDVALNGLVIVSESTSLPRMFALKVDNGRLWSWIDQLPSRQTEVLGNKTLFYYPALEEGIYWLDVETVFAAGHGSLPTWQPIHILGDLTNVVWGIPFQ